MNQYQEIPEGDPVPVLVVMDGKLFEQRRHKWDCGMLLMDSVPGPAFYSQRHGYEIQLPPTTNELQTAIDRLGDASDLSSESQMFMCNPLRHPHYELRIRFPSKAKLDVFVDALQDILRLARDP